MSNTKTTVSEEKQTIIKILTEKIGEKKLMVDEIGKSQGKIGVFKQFGILGETEALKEVIELIEKIDEVKE